MHPTLFDAQSAAKSAQRVPATAHTDDGNVVVAFDATPFFEIAHDDLIRDLIEDSFAGGYGADAVAQDLANKDNELGRMFWYLKNINERRDEFIGYEVSVDAVAAKQWLKCYRPHLLLKEA